MEKHKHEKIIEENIIREHIAEIENQLISLENRRLELELIKQSIDELKKHKDKEIMVPIGAGVLMLGKIVDENNVLINIGSNVFIQKNSEDAKVLIEEQIKEIDAMKESLRKELEKFA